MKSLLLLPLLLGSALAMSKLSPAALLDVQQEYCVTDSVRVFRPDSGNVTCDTAGGPGSYVYVRHYELRITLPIDLGVDGKRWLTLVVPLTSPTGHDTVRVTGGAN